MFPVVAGVIMSVTLKPDVPNARNVKSILRKLYRKYSTNYFNNLKTRRSAVTTRRAVASDEFVSGCPATSPPCYGINIFRK